MKVAVICFENPYCAPMDGAKNDIKTRIESLSRIDDCEIDIYAFNKTNEKRADVDVYSLGIHCLYQYDVRKTSIRTIMSKLPISVYRRINSECINELKKHLYDAIIYEGEHMSSYRLFSFTHAKKHFLRQHDIESKYRYELSKASPSLVYKIAQIIEAIKYKRIEKNIDIFFDSVLFISDDEKAEFSKMFPRSNEKFIYMPPSTMGFADSICINTVPDRLLYIGNMELNNNVLSIKWFSQKVFPYILKENKYARLRIIGKCSEKDKHYLESISQSIEVLGYVENLEAEIRQASIIVLPVLYGAGVKVKVIDALSYGQIVCTTSKAIEGTLLKPGKHLVVEDDPHTMAKECIMIMKNRMRYSRMAEEGLKYVKTNHSIESQKRILEKIIKSQCAWKE